jgi:hypothetical protein
MNRQSLFVFISLALNLPLGFQAAPPVSIEQMAKPIHCSSRVFARAQA